MTCVDLGKLGVLQCISPQQKCTPKYERALVCALEVHKSWSAYWVLRNGVLIHTCVHSCLLNSISHCQTTVPILSRQTAKYLPSSTDVDLLCPFLYTVEYLYSGMHCGIPICHIYGHVTDRYSTMHFTSAGDSSHSELKYAPQSLELQVHKFVNFTLAWSRSL